MDKLKENMRKLFEKIKGLSKRKKIAFGTLALGVIVGIIYLMIYFNKTNYAILFKDMDPKDAQTVLAKLNEKKIEYKIENNTIRVPEEKAPELRMEIAPTLKDGSKGYEILDEGSKWGMTDKEMDTKYQIALQGEIERTIETFPEVEKADVKLVMQQQSNFFKKEDPAQASVTLHFKDGKKVNKDQIKAIVSLVTGSVRNLSKESVRVIGVIDGTTSVLSEELFEDDNKSFGNATDKQRTYEKNIEKEYEKKILTLLTPKYGAGVQVAVDVEADFNASQKTSTSWDKPVVRSEKIVKDKNGNTTQNTSNSPVDNNMSNTYSNQQANGLNSSHDETTKNYEVGKVEEKIVSAPGKIKKVSASVIVDSSGLSDNEKNKINNAVQAAIAYDQKRGDIISVEGMSFGGEVDNTDLEKQKEQAEAAKKMSMYKYIGIGAAAVAALITILILVIKKRKKNQEEEETQMDYLIDDTIEPKEPLKAIDFEEDNEKTHLEKEIKKYSSEKPDQVAEIIKAWMAEDER